MVTKERVYEANREAANFFYKQLKIQVGKNGLDYLHGRQLSDGTIKNFGLGFAPDSYVSLTNYLLNRGFTPEELVKANLASVKKSSEGKPQIDGRDLYDRFRNRVMFPILDVQNKVVAFGGRVMSDEKPKYLNSSDTPVFKKSYNLFALNKAKNTNADGFILCEGYMDVIALQQAGFDNAIATLGTSLTEEQAAIIKRYTDTVTLCYDADVAGQNATSRAIDILTKEGIDIKILSIPDGKDPDEFIKRHGADGHKAFQRLIDNAVSPLEYQMTKLYQQYDLDTQKAQFLNEAAKLLSKHTVRIEREIFAERLCEETDFDKDVFDKQIIEYIKSFYRGDRNVADYITPEVKAQGCESLQGLQEGSNCFYWDSQTFICEFGEHKDQNGEFIYSCGYDTDNDDFTFNRVYIHGHDNNIIEARFTDSQKDVIIDYMNNMMKEKEAEMF